MDPIAIGAKLKKLRGDKTIAAVSADLNISPSALTMYELGARIPRDETKIRIASYYGVSIESLFYSSNCHDK